MNDRLSNGVEILREGSVVVACFTRPEIRNPMSREIVERLHELADDLVNQPDIEKLIFTGSGDAFASGANLNEIASITSDEAADFARLGQMLMQKISDLSQLTVAAVNGYCFGGALDLALACNIRIASPNAKFAHPGAGLGIITGWGGTQRLPRLVGTSNALEMFFTAAPIDAERARKVGLIDEIAEDVLERALS